MLGFADIETCYMIEVNPIIQSLKELHERTELLRGYL